MPHKFAWQLLPMLFAMLVCVFSVPAQAENKGAGMSHGEHGGRPPEMGSRREAGPPEHGPRMENRDGQRPGEGQRPQRPEQFSERHDGNREFAQDGRPNGPPPQRHEGPEGQRGEGGGGRPPHGPDGGRGPEHGGPGHGPEQGHGGGGHGPQPE